MRQMNFKNVVWKEGKYYVAWNLNTGVSSFGSSRKDALASLQEALELHLEDASLSVIPRVDSPVLWRIMVSILFGKKVRTLGMRR